MIFVFDVGNSNITMGLYDGENLVKRWRMTTDIEKTSDEYGVFLNSCFMLENIDMKCVEGVIIGSVVPPLMYSLEHAVRKYFRKNPMIVGPGVKTGVNLKIENPKEVGADRIVNVVAACEIYKGPLILVDFGTATTYDAISRKNEYLGGVICPGIKISADALFNRASKLPRVELSRPDTVIGNNTVKGMQSGLIYGVLGQVEYLVNHMKKEMNDTDIKVVATGGLARMLASATEVIDDIAANLTLEGLRLIYNKNA